MESRNQKIFLIGAVIVLAIILISAFFKYNKSFLISNSPSKSNPIMVFENKERNINMSFDIYDNNTNQILRSEKFILSYSVPFDTKEESFNDYDANIKGEDFSLYLYVSNPPDIGIFTKPYISENYIDLNLPNTSNRIIRTKVDENVQFKYGYHEFIDKYYDKDVNCTDKNCPDIELFSYSEAIHIDDTKPDYYYFFPLCEAASKEGLDKCDAIIKSLKFK